MWGRISTISTEKIKKISDFLWYIKKCLYLCKTGINHMANWQVECIENVFFDTPCLLPSDQTPAASCKPCHNAHASGRKKNYTWIILEFWLWGRCAAVKLRTSILLPSRPTVGEHIGHKTRTTPSHPAAAIEANSSRCGQLWILQYYGIFGATFSVFN